MAMHPYDETYDRRRLASKPHVVELRDRGFDKIVYRDGLPESKYRNKILESVPTCGSPCWAKATTRLGFTEQGVDVFVAPVSVAPGRFVYVAKLPAGNHICGECGSDITVTE